jgi:hypothetical protein
MSRRDGRFLAPYEVREQYLLDSALIGAVLFVIGLLTYFYAR